MLQSGLENKSRNAEHGTISQPGSAQSGGKEAEEEEGSAPEAGIGCWK